MKTRILWSGLAAGIALLPCLAAGQTRGYTTAGQNNQEAEEAEFWKVAGQDKFSLSDLMKGDRLPTVIKPADLPAGYQAFRIQAASGGGIGDLLNNPLMLLMVFGSGNRRDKAVVEMVGLLDLSWTRGEVVQLITAKDRETLDSKNAMALPYANKEAEGYLVTYRADLGIPELVDLTDNPSKLGDVTLKLHLIKFKSIVSVTPRPEFTKEKLLSLVGAKGAEIEKEPSTKDRAMRLTGLVNAKQLAMALIMTTTDNDDAFPFVQSTAEVRRAIAPYVKKEALWETLNPKSQFRFNMCLSGVLATAVPEPAQTPLIYESAPFAKDGRRIVAFVDGHAKQVTEAEWNAMAKYLKLKLPREPKHRPTSPRAPEPTKH